MANEEFTTIQISKRNHARLDALGQRNEKFDNILTRVLDIFEIKRADELTGERHGKPIDE